MSGVSEEQQGGGAAEEQRKGDLGGGEGVVRALPQWPVSTKQASLLC